MPIVYLEPGDLSGQQAQQVLDFLNRATSAQQLGRDIEFPNELDIGVKLGQRLLDARAALGGAFTQINQVRAVRLIGPERFTEICVAALGLDLRRWVALFYGAAPMAPQTESGLVVSLEMRPQPAWLGQPLMLTVRVADKGGAPRLGVPVALHTGVGRLVAMFGFSRLEGEAITVVTGADGSADLELVVEPSEPLSQVQQSALEHALGGLDAAAPDPQKLNPAFAAMVESYLQERSYNLRRAVDVWVRDQRDAMVDSINPTRWAFGWPMRSALIQADVMAADGGGASLARAVATATWKNWVGAWLLALDAQLRQAGKLDAALNEADGGEDGSKLVGDLLGRTQRFVASVPGRSAELLGRKQVQAAVVKLVNGDLSRLPALAQADVLTQLETAALEVRPTTLGSYTLVTKTRKDLSGRIEEIGKIGSGNLSRMEALAQQVDQRAFQVDQRAALIDQRAVLVDQRAAQVEARASAIDGLASQVNAQAVQMTQLATQFQQIGGNLGNQVAQFNTDLATFNRNRVQLATRIDGLQTDLVSVNRKIDLMAPREAPPAAPARRRRKPPAGTP